MASFDDLLTKARTAPRPHKDVDVILDRSVSARTAELRQQIEDLNRELAMIEEDKRLSDPRPGEIITKIDELSQEIEDVAAGSVVTFRFTQAGGQQWAEWRGRSLPRLDVPLDRSYGFNYHETAKLAATQTGVRLLDPDSDPVETETLTAEQWNGLWEVLSGHEFEKIASRIFELNEFDPEQQIARAGKASRAGSDSKSN